MRLKKTISIGIIITVIAIGQVHQHVEIIKAGYGLQRNRERLFSLVDQNTKLMYNLSKLESPRYLLASMKREEIEFADRRIRQANSYRLAYADPGYSGGKVSFVGRFFDLFTLSAEAKPREPNTN